VRRDNDPDAVAHAPQRRLDELDRLDDQDLIVREHLSGLEDPRDDPGVHDLLELLEPPRIGEHDVGELAPIDLLVLTEHLRPELLDDRAVARRAPALLVPGDRVGVEDARAERPQHRGGRALSRPDRPGEPDDERAHGSVSLDPALADHSS